MGTRQGPFSSVLLCPCWHAHIPPHNATRPAAKRLFSELCAPQRLLSFGLLPSSRIYPSPVTFGVPGALTQQERIWISRDFGCGSVRPFGTVTTILSALGYVSEPCGPQMLISLASVQLHMGVSAQSWPAGPFFSTTGHQGLIHCVCLSHV